jgi:membrane protein
MKKLSEKQSLGVWIVNFVKRGQWLLPMNELSKPRRLAVKALRFVSLVLHGFQSNRCSLHAASLTFYSLMALVPVLVLALGLARSLGGADVLQRQVSTHIDAWLTQMEQPASTSLQPALPDVRQGQASDQVAVVRLFGQQAREISSKLFQQIEGIDFGTLGLIGLLLLLWTIIGLLEKIENSFNQIWGAERPRSLIRKFTDYTSVSIVLPILIVAASSIPVASHVVEVMDKTLGGGTAETVRGFMGSSLLRMSLTLVLGTLMFAFLLGFMPNERVRFKPAIVGGFVTMLLFVAWLKLCAMLQVGIARSSMVYGGFALLPILLLWMYTSWQIVLIGAEIAFAAQNRDTYVLEQYAAEANLRTRIVLACALCAEAAKRAVERDAGPFAAEEFAREHGIPHRLVREVLDRLERNGVFAQVAGREERYVLCRYGTGMTAAEIINLFLDEGEAPEALGINNLGQEGQGVDQLLRSVVEKHFTVPLHVFAEQDEIKKKV